MVAWKHSTTQSESTQTQTSYQRFGPYPSCSTNDCRFRYQLLHLSVTLRTMASDSRPTATDNEPSRVSTQVDQESKLIEEIQFAVSEQKATFYCGGSVPIIANSDEAEKHRFDDVAGMITSPPVLLRWDLPSGMYAPISYLLFFATPSPSTVSSTAERPSYSPGALRFYDHWSSKSRADEGYDHR